MKARHHRQNWEELSIIDPLWAILSDPQKRFGRWDLEEFFQTGEKEIGYVMDKAKRLELPARFVRALDFGCGVGRLTRAIRPYFQECFGVDISEPMIRRARELSLNCEFRVNVGWNLQLFPDNYFDFVYSSLVLQHQPTREVIVAYIAEFLRVLRHSGLLVFQLPSHIPWRNRIQTRRRVWSLLRTVGVGSEFLYRRLKLTPIRMNWITEAETIAHITRFGGWVIDVEHLQQAGEPFVSRVYYCTK